MLFRLTEEADIPAVNSNSFVSVKGNDSERFLGGRGHQVLKEVLSDFKQGESIHYITEGHWHLHELITGLLMITGPAKLYLSTWAMSEDPVRALLNLIEQKYITELNCVFDYKTTTQAPKVLQLVTTISSRVKVCHCHAKMFVIENDSWLIVNNGSANLTKNPRLESGVICSNKIVAARYRDKILEKFNEPES